MPTITFSVPGKPAPQGSKRHVGHGVMIESSKEVGPWRERVALAAHNEMVRQNRSILTGVPVRIKIAFVMPRPASAPKRSTPPAIKRPDIDKLTRACLDALSRVIYSDDSQVVDLRVTKRLAELGETPGAEITVAEITAGSQRSLPDTTKELTLL
ncbi:MULTISPECIES: RusA family crossover junction endodeoxyribonuclease [unclassified Mycobacterium]|uniref:RusA family crossover junction endodeoxyribonuclease n=1 Tax=unclassified Mycobacterium TaxID=2642494 RepID=UPI0009EE84B0|nr:MULTISPECIES: RusA family crossover junction endodeoxyribonuclease [unclassified Mycobacterium]